MVKKVLLVSIIALAVIALIPLLYAQLNTNQISITKVYGPSQMFQGTFNLTLSQEPNSLITVNVADITKQLYLDSFLKSNKAAFNCTPSNCLAYYTTSNPSPTKTVNPNSETYFAIIAEGNTVSITSLSFKMLGRTSSLNAEILR